jgi:hypothetical protein
MGADETQIEASFCAALGIFSTTSLVTARSAVSLGLVVGSPALSNKRLRCKARTFRLQRSAKGGVLSQGCLGELVIEGPRQIDGTR